MASFSEQNLLNTESKTKKDACFMNVSDPSKEKTPFRAWLSKYWRYYSIEQSYSRKPKENTQFILDQFQR